MPLRNHHGKICIVRAALVTGAAFVAAANIAHAAPSVDPAPAVSPPDSSNTKPQPHSDSMGDAISDTAITTKVKWNLANDKRVHDSKIKVTTTNGVVTLSGSAPDHDSAAAAVEIAQSISGVKNVDDQIHSPSAVDRLATGADRLTDNAKAEASDTVITSKVKTELLTSKTMKGADLSATTNNGVVQLTGQVQSDEQKDAAKQLVQQVEGVKSVDASGIVVASTR